MASASEQVFRQTIIDFPVRDKDPENTTNALKQIDAYVSWATTDGKMDEQSALKTFTHAIFQGAKDRGKDYRAMYNSMPPELQKKLLLTPDEFDQDTDVTIAGVKLQLSSQVAYLVGLGASVLATVALHSKLPGWLKVPQILILMYGLTGFFAAFSQTVGTIVNNWNDVNFWGPVILGGQAQDILAAELKAGLKGLGTQVPKTRATTYSTAKPKLFTGIIYNGQVGKYEQFVRSLDDAITSDEDLKQDVEINLVKYISKIPNNLSYSIQIKNSPADELGIPRSGTWCTLSIYLTNQFHKRVFIDEILLGPVDPFVYYPESQKVEALQYEVPKLVKFEDIHPTDRYTGQERLVDTAGNIITDVLKDGTKVVAGMSVTAEPVATIPSPAPTTAKEKMQRYGVTLYKSEGRIVYHERGSAALVAGMGTITQQENIPRELGIGLDEILDMPGRTQDELLKAGLNGAQRGKRDYTPAQFAEYLNQYVVNEFGATMKTPEVTSSFPKQVKVFVDKLNVRAEPTSQSVTAGSKQLYKGDVFTAVALVEGETVSGNNKWYKSSFGHFVWSGGAS